MHIFRYMQLNENRDELFRDRKFYDDQESFIQFSRQGCQSLGTNRVFHLQRILQHSV